MRKCRHCRTEIPPKAKSDHWQRAGFCCCDHMAAHGLQKAQEQRKRKADREAKEKRKRLRERKEAAMTLQEWINRAQEYRNKLVVMQDAPLGCISCGSPNVSDAGHYFHRGSKYRTEWLTLYRGNLVGQCRSCNSYKGGGNQHEYRLGYIERYGQEAFDRLCELKRLTDCKEVPRPTIEQVQEFIAEMKRQIKAERSRN